MPDMEPRTENPLSNAIAKAASALAAILGFIALAGWTFHHPALAGLGQGWVPMAPITALLFILFGSAVFSAASLPASRTAHWFGIGTGLSGALIALLLFFLAYQGIYLEAEHLGFTITGTVGSTPIGHMSPATALCFLLAGLSLVAVLAASSGSSILARTGFGLSGLMTFISIVFLLGYLFGTPLLYGGKFIPPALTTSIAFAALGSALLAFARPRLRTFNQQTDEEARRASRSFVLIFILTAIGLIKVGSIYYAQNVKQQRAAMEQELSAIADLKVNELVKWREERLGDANLLYGNPGFADLLRHAQGSAANAQDRNQLAIWLRQIREAYGYAEIHLIDAHGVAQISVPPHSPTTDELEAAHKALISGKVSLDDFHIDEDEAAPRLSLLVPILDAASGGRSLGVAILEIDANKHLYPMIGLWPTLSPSAEALLVRRDGGDVLYLNDLRYRKNTALSLRYPLTRTELPAVKAVLGQEGIVEGVDYRGAPVIAALRAVPGTPWFLVARMNRDEFLASIEESLWLTAGLVAALLLSAGMLMGIIWRQQRLRHYRERTRAAEALASSATRYRAVTQTALDGIVTADSSGIIVDWNSGAERMFGYAESEIIGQPLAILMPERLRKQYLDGLNQVRAGDELDVIGKTIELRGRCKDASEFPMEMSLTEWSVGGDQYITGTIHDITRRKAAETRIRRHTQLYAALSECNKAIVHSTGEAELFPRICRAAVQFGGMKTAWIGIIDSDTLMVQPVASFGDDLGFVKDFVVSVDAHNPYSDGPTGTAIREDRPFWSSNILNDPRSAPWRDLVVRHNLVSIASLPLHRNGKVIGAFVLYSGEGNAFDESVRDLLIEMTADISFALDNFTRETQRKEAEQMLRTAEEQFRSLVEQTIAGIFIIQDGKFVYVNPRFAEIRGYSKPDEMIGLDVMSLIAEKDHSIVAENNRRLFAGEIRDINYSFTALRKDGSSVDVGTHTSFASYHGRPALIGMLQDISEKKRAEESIQHYIAQLKTAFMSTVQVATIMSEMRDPYTAGHERRVAEIAVAISAELGFDEKRQEGLRVAGLLHDIGKITIPSEMLSKPGKLSAIEFQLIQEHAMAGYDVLKTVEWPWPIAEVALQHHERIDGSGYPQGLKGDAILLEARILAVADVVEAMSSHRPYRAGLGIEKALAEIKRGRGTMYDAEVTDACLEMLRKRDYILPV